MFNPSDIVYSRRLFLTRGVQLLSIAGTLPMFLDRSAHAMAADFAANPAGAGRPDHRVLVVVQLAGGNDGLNTVVPLGNDDYYKARPKLGVAQGSALKLTDQFGLHPAAVGFKKLYDAGDLAIVHSVGYPNPNRSHFRSTDIWTTGEPDKLGSSGWLGRYCDACCSGVDPGPANGAHALARKDIDPAMALALDVEPPPALQGVKYLPLTFRPENGPRGKGNKAAMARQNANSANDILTKLNGPEAMHDGMGAMAAHRTGADQTEEFLQRTALNARVYADKIRNISSSIENKGAYPQTGLGRDLKLVSQLIASSLPTRVYYVKLGGFDTHAEQLQRHPRLLAELSGGIAAFVEDLRQMGNLDRVTLMTFSEFGRRVHENGSGTDHGEAAPLFLAGGAVKAGLHGAFSSLAPSNLHRGDVPFTTDFRRVYATLLHNWLGANDVGILGRKFAPMGVLSV
ncbi:MAG TPA: DUF1501 domain-containing protein [Tepidisphaeraceae bacterium]|nr:DUF1501 domain-containing protein [Tepidisphaeraceae bacterium]